MKDDRKEPRAKRSYQSPELVRIVLRADEAVLGKCKSQNAQGPAGSACNPATCKSTGS